MLQSQCLYLQHFEKEKKTKCMPIYLVYMFLGWDTNVLVCYHFLIIWQISFYSLSFLANLPDQPCHLSIQSSLDGCGLISLFWPFTSQPIRPFLSWQVTWGHRGGLDTSIYTSVQMALFSFCSTIINFFQKKELCWAGCHSIEVAFTLPARAARVRLSALEIFSWNEI